MKNLDWRRILPIVMLFAGLALLGYVATQYSQMYFAQRALAHRWAEQQAAPPSPTSSADAKPADDGLVRLSIPKINLDDVVVEGTNHKSLLLGPGHLEDTPQPGDAGNAVISGHRDTFFRHIHELEKGDVVTVQRSGRTYQYEVTGKRIVPPEDMSVIGPTQDTELTLITCYPTYYIGPAPDRLVVFTRLITPKDQATNASDATAAAAAH